MSRKKSPEDRVAAIAPFGLRMPSDLRDRISKAAVAKGRSMNAEILDLLNDHYPPEIEINELVGIVEELLDDSLGNDWRPNRKWLVEHLRNLRDRIREEGGAGIRPEG